MEQIALTRFENAHITLYCWQQISDEEKKDYIRQTGLVLGMDLADIILVENNIKVFDGFIERAHRVVNQGRERFSPRTIVEVMRWNTQIEDNDRTFKITNNIVRPMSHIAMEIFPALNNLFAKHSK